MKLLFMHMSKCGGRSFYEFLSSNYSEWVNWSEGKQLSYAELVFANESPLVFGHIKYNTAKEFKDHKIITVLRDPLERAISEYNHLMNHNQDFAGVKIMKEDNYSFMDFVKSTHIAILGWVNYYCASLYNGAGDHRSADEAVNSSKANLESLDFVGIYERMDETVDRMKAKYGLEGDLPVIGKTIKKHKIAKLTDAERGEAKRYLAMDYEVYEFGKKLFNETEGVS